MDRWVAPPKQVASPTWSCPPPCKQDLGGPNHIWLLQWLASEGLLNISEGVLKFAAVLKKVIMPHTGVSKLSEIWGKYDHSLRLSFLLLVHINLILHISQK